MTSFFADCCQLFNHIYIYCADIPYFRFLFDFVAIAIALSMFRLTYRASRRM